MASTALYNCPKCFPSWVSGGMSKSASASFQLESCIIVCKAALWASRLIVAGEYESFWIKAVRKGNSSWNEAKSIVFASFIHIPDKELSQRFSRVVGNAMKSVRE